MLKNWTFEKFNKAQMHDPENKGYEELDVPENLERSQISLDAYDSKNDTENNAKIGCFV